MHLCCICLWAVHKHWARWWEWEKRANHLFTQSRITHSAFTLFTNYSPYTSSAEKTMCALHVTQLQHTLESVPDTECSSPISCIFCNYFVQIHNIVNCKVLKVECIVHICKHTMHIDALHIAAFTAWIERYITHSGQVALEWRLLHIPLKLGERTPLGGPCCPPHWATLHISHFSRLEEQRRVSRIPHCTLSFLYQASDRKLGSQLHMVGSHSDEMWEPLSS